MGPLKHTRQPTTSVCPTYMLVLRCIPLRPCLLITRRLLAILQVYPALLVLLIHLHAQLVHLLRRLRLEEQRQTRLIVSTSVQYPRFQMSVPKEGVGYLTDEEEEGEDEEEGVLRQSKDSVPDVYLPPDGGDGDEEQDASISEALQSISRSSSPFSEQVQPTPRKNYDYVVPLRSEPKVRSCGSPNTMLLPR